MNKAQLEIEYRTRGVTEATQELANAEQVAKRAEEQSDRTRRSGDELGSAFQRASTAFRNFSDRMNTVSRRLISVGRTLSLRVTAPLAALGTMAVRTAGNFEASMNQVRAVTGATGDDFESLQSLARELGATTQFSASQAAEGMTYLAMAGFETEAILESMAGTLNLAAAAQIDLGESADIVSNVMTAFGLEARELESAVDVLTATFTSSNTTLTQLGDAMAYVAPVAASLGVSVEETAAALGVLSDAGIQGSMAGTSLRAIMTQLVQNADRLGISTRDAAGNVLPLADMLEQLEDRALSAEQLLEVFGRIAGPAMAVLLARGSAGLREFTSELEESGGTAERVAETQMEGFNGMMREFRSVLEEAAITIGEELIPALTDIIGRIRDAVRSFSEMDESQQQTIIRVSLVAAALGPLAVGIGLVKKAVGALSLAMAVLAANPIVAAIAAVVALAAAVYNLWRAFDRREADRIGETFGHIAETATMARREIQRLETDLSTIAMMAADESAMRYFVQWAAEGYDVQTRTVVQMGLAMEDVTGEHREWLQAMEEEYQRQEAIALIELERAATVSGYLESAEASEAMARAQKEIAAAQLEIEEGINAALGRREEVTQSYLEARQVVLGILDSERSEMDRIQDTIDYLNAHPWAPGMLEEDRLAALQILEERLAALREPGLTFEDEVDRQLRGVERLAAQYAELGVEFDLARAQSDIVTAAIRRLAENYDIADDVVAAFTERYRDLVQVTARSADDGGDPASPTITQQFMAQLEAIDRLGEAYDRLQIDYDDAGARSDAFRTALQQMARDANVSAEAMEAFSDQFRHLLVREEKEEIEEITRTFEDQLDTIDRLATVYDQLGIDYDAAEEKAAAFERQVRALATAQDFCQESLDELIATHRDLLNLDSPYEEMSRALLWVVNALGMTVDEARTLHEELESIAEDLKRIAGQQYLRFFDDFGTALGEGASGSEALTIALQSFGMAMLEILPQIMLRLGLAILEHTPRLWPVAMGLILGAGAARAGTSFLQAQESPQGSATGSVIERGQIKPHYAGGIIDSPILFPLGSGIGSAGERGAEAIMPLSRTPGGDLGVQVAGVVPRVNVTVHNYSGEPVDVQETESGDGRELEIAIGRMVGQAIDGGSADAALQRSFGLQRRGQ